MEISSLRVGNGECARVGRELNVGLRGPSGIAAV